MALLIDVTERTPPERTVSGANWTWTFRGVAGSPRILAGLIISLLGASFGSMIRTPYCGAEWRLSPFDAGLPPFSIEYAQAVSVALGVSVVNGRQTTPSRGGILQPFLLGWGPGAGVPCRSMRITAPVVCSKASKVRVSDTPKRDGVGRTTMEATPSRPSAARERHIEGEPE